MAEVADMLAMSLDELNNIISSSVKNLSILTFK